jgi:hypothetical protein
MPEMVLFQVGNAFPQMLQNLQNMGIFLYLFPFLLSLAIFYGVFSTVFKDKMQKSAISLISIVLAFFVMLFSSWNPAIVTFFASISGTGLLIASGILFLFLILGMAGFDVKRLLSDDKDKPRWAAILIVVFIVALIFFGAGAGNLIPLPTWATGSSELWTAIFFIIIIAMAMWWMGNSGDSK